MMLPGPHAFTTIRDCIGGPLVHRCVCGALTDSGLCYACRQAMADQPGEYGTWEPEGITTLGSWLPQQRRAQQLHRRGCASR